MRIGFLGNTNNFPFMLASALKKRGHEVRFLLDQLDPLYRPEGKFEAIDVRALDWIQDLSPMRFRDYIFTSSRKRVAIQVLRECDVVVLNQYGPSLLRQVRRPAMAMLTGSDLEFFANPDAITDYAQRARGGSQSSWLKRHALAWGLRRLARMQRKGIRMARLISYFPRGAVPAGDRLLDELGVDDRKRIFIPMTDTDALRASPPVYNDPPRVACVARLNWKMPMRPGATQLDYKGTDVILKGLRKYIVDRRREIEIHLFRKGWDVAETELLVSQLGLERCVRWHDELTQAELLHLIRSSDVVIDQVAQSIAGFGAIDSMAVGRPVIANWREEIIPNYRLPDDARCQASTVEEVAGQLDRLLSDRQELASVSVASRRFVEKRFSPDATAAYCEKRLRQIASEPVN